MRKDKGGKGDERKREELEKRVEELEERLEKRDREKRKNNIMVKGIEDRKGKHKGSGERGDEKGEGGGRD